METKQHAIKNKWINEEIKKEIKETLKPTDLENELRIAGGKDRERDS